MTLTAIINFLIMCCFVFVIVSSLLIELNYDEFIKDKERRDAARQRRLDRIRAEQDLAEFREKFFEEWKEMEVDE